MLIYRSPIYGGRKVRTMQSAVPR